MREIIYALESIKDREVIENFIKRQDSNECQMLINALRYTNEETEKYWLRVYSDLFKY